MEGSDQRLQAGGPRAAAIYCRVNPAAALEDLARQEERCRAYAVAQGYPVEAIYTYREVASGISHDRPEFQRLREAIRQGTVAVVIADAPDRLSRDLPQLMAVIREARGQGIGLEFLNGWAMRSSGSPPSDGPVLSVQELFRWVGIEIRPEPPQAMVGATDETLVCCGAAFPTFQAWLAHRRERHPLP